LESVKCSIIDDAVMPAQVSGEKARSKCGLELA
jgi:hypothetical protein